MVSHTTATFGSHRHRGNKDIMVLVCYVISQDHLTKGSSNIIGRHPSREVTILSRLVVIDNVVVEI